MQPLSHKLDADSAKQFIDNVHFVSGFGQFHTNEPKAKKRKPYTTITPNEIRALVNNPRRDNKKYNQWFIPSILQSRVFKNQKENGEFWALVADIDKDPPEFKMLFNLLKESIIPGCQFETFTSSTATKENQKTHVIIFLDRPLLGSFWEICQEILNDKLEALGVTPDRATERFAQLSYLPNTESDFYLNNSVREGAFLDPLMVWDKEIKEKCAAMAEKKKELQKKHKTAQEKRKNNLDKKDSSIAEFNANHTIEELLLEANYTQDPKNENNFRHPKSESGSHSAEIKIDDQGVERVHSLSSSDPLYTDGEGAHDAFSVNAVLFHNSDINAAVQDFAEDQKGEQAIAVFESETNSEPVREPKKPVNTFNETLDIESTGSQVDLLKHLDSEQLTRTLSEHIADRTQLPVNSIFLMVLSVYGAVASRRYCVKYPDGRRLPIGLYTIVEQPSGSSKSWCLDILQSPFHRIRAIKIDLITTQIAILEKKKNKTEEEQEELENLKEKEESMKGKLFITNATAEGMESTLSKTHGFFAAVSSEQGLLNSMLGHTYRNETKSNNNDVLLSGFDGGYVDCVRVNRKGYSGRVAGGVACFAQNGSVEKVLEASNGTGLAERFLMLAEPSFLGKRDFIERTDRDRHITDSYSRTCNFYREVIENPNNFNDLTVLKISDESDLKIRKLKNEIEPHLANGERYSHVALRGAASKIDMQVMKIAAIIHLIDINSAFDLDAFELELEPKQEIESTEESEIEEESNEIVISDSCVDSAINIARDLLEANLRLCESKGIVGLRAEFNAILSLFDKDSRPRTERQIIQSVIGKKPFCEYTGNKSNLVRETLEKMDKQNLLKTKVLKDKTHYGIGQ